VATAATIATPHHLILDLLIVSTPSLCPFFRHGERWN